MQKLRVGILGTGKMGRVYARWFAENPHCEVSALYNRTRQKAEDLANRYPSARVYDTWESLIRENGVDVVGICTPSHEHLAQIRAAVDAKKHILCEKPMANDLDECQCIVDLSRSSTTKIMVGFQMRFHPVVQTVDRLVGGIGKVYHIDFTFGLYRPGIGWRHSLVEGGGVLKELASHLFDLMHRWVGDVASVHGMNKIVEPGREVEDFSLNVLTFTNGASGFLFSSYLDRRSPVIQGNLMGTHGQISFQLSSYDPAHSRVTLLTDTREEIPVEIPCDIDKVYPGHLDSFKKEIDQFVACILTDAVPPISVADGCRTIELIDASYESTRIGAPVVLPLSGFSRSRLTDCFERVTEED